MEKKELSEKKSPVDGLTDEELEKIFAQADEIVAAYDAELAEQEKNDPAMAAIKKYFMQLQPRPYSLQDMKPIGGFAENFCEKEY